MISGKVDGKELGDGMVDGRRKRLKKPPGFGFTAGLDSFGSSSTGEVGATVGEVSSCGVTEGCGFSVGVVLAGVGVGEMGVGVSVAGFSSTMPRASVAESSPRMSLDKVS